MDAEKYAPRNFGTKFDMRQSKRQMLSLVNPTHIAVALKYDRGEMDAPTVVAKGADLIAHTNTRNRQKSECSDNARCSACKGTF